MKDREFDAVVELAQRSAIWRVARWAIDACRDSWGTSSIVRAAIRFWSPISAWPAETRVRGAALTVAWAGIGHAVGLVVLPRYVVSGLPLWWIGTVVFAALIVAAAPQAFTIAWNAKFEENRTGD